MGRRGHTGPKDIERIERVCAVLRMRLEGLTYRQIGQRLDPPVTAQAIFRTYWRTLDANPPNQRRWRAALERAALTASG
jgi:hypothetical protein